MTDMRCGSRMMDTAAEGRAREGKGKTMQLEGHRKKLSESEVLLGLGQEGGEE